MFGGFGGLSRKGHDGSSLLGPVKPHQQFRDITPPTLGPITGDAPTVIVGRPRHLGVVNAPQTWPAETKSEHVEALPPLRMKPVTNVKLSILIPTVSSRAPLLDKLRHKLQKQIAALGADLQVQALTFKDSQHYSVGAKKSRLLEEAEGEYVVFMDDDDDISDDYLPEILNAIQQHSGVDCIGMRALLSSKGEKPRKVVYSLANQGATEIVGVCFRPPCPSTPMRRVIAGGYPYVNTNDGEDADLAYRMTMGQAIATEFFIDKALLTQDKSRFDAKWAGGMGSAIPAPEAPAERPPSRRGASPDKLKISCILTSYNRPQMVRQALKSLQDQTHKNFEVLLFDDSSQMNILPILGEFTLPISQIFISKVTPLQRRTTNRLSVNINRGLAVATGDLVCFLADDDYYFPGWFEAAARYFQEHPDVNVGYGKLVYSRSSAMEMKQGKEMRWPGTVVTKPYNILDHNQVIHRRFPTPYPWPETFKTLGNPDAHYFRAVAQKHGFHPISAYAAVKRLHSKNLQSTISDVVAEKAENIRE